MAGEELVALADELGMSRLVDDQVRRSALATAPAEVALALRVAPYQVEDPAFADRIAAQVDRVGRPRDRVWLGIVARVVTSDEGVAATTLEALGRRGFRIVLDDFCRGSVPLDELPRLKVDVVKIPAEVTAAVATSDRDAAFVRATVAVADAAGATCAAAGVETAAQRDRLVELGCRLQQGPLFPDAR